MNTLANLNKIVLEVLNENTNLDLQNENNRLLLSNKITERYTNLVKDIAKNFLEKEVEKRSTLSTFQGLFNKQ